MRIALVCTDTKADGTKCACPTALLYLATTLRENGFEVAVFDRDGYSGGMEEMVGKIADFCPDLVGVQVMTSGKFLESVKDFLGLVRAKMPEVRVVAGGPHCTALPEETLEWFPAIDYVLIGECEETLCELAGQMAGNAASLEVPGLYCRGSDGIVSFPAADPPKDLDAIPIPDRKFLWDNYVNGLYWRLDRKGIMDTVMTSRGCPFACRFCFKVAKGVRLRSPENVVKELVYLAQLGITNIDVLDDLFTTKKTRAIEICRMIRDAGLRLDLKVRSRVDTVDAELLSEMRRAGVKTVVYGFESGSQKMLDAMNKRTRVEDNYEAVRMTKKAGLRCYADMFVGFPGETPETIEETTRFLLKAKPTVVNGGVLVPLPRTWVYEDAKKNGTLVGDWAMGVADPYVKLPWMNDLSDLWRAYHRLRRSFYTNPSVLLGMVRGLPTKLDFRILSKGWRFVRLMIGHG